MNISIKKGPKFIITGLPRSGTTWLSNFIMTDDLVCLHDCIGFSITPDELLTYDMGLTFTAKPLSILVVSPYRSTSHLTQFGISDTTIWMFPDVIQECIFRDIPIIVIERDLSEINQSLTELKLPNVTKDQYEQFEDFCNKFPQLLRISFADMFSDNESLSLNVLEQIWNKCHDQKFNIQRAKLLRLIDIQPKFNSLVPNTEIFRSTINSLYNQIKETNKMPYTPEESRRRHIAQVIEWQKRNPQKVRKYVDKYNSKEEIREKKRERERKRKQKEKEES